jgi:hypothetical protein
MVTVMQGDEEGGADEDPLEEDPFAWMGHSQPPPPSPPLQQPQATQQQAAVGGAAAAAAARQPPKEQPRHGSAKVHHSCLKDRLYEKGIHFESAIPRVSSWYICRLAIHLLLCTGMLGAVTIVHAATLLHARGWQTLQAVGADAFYDYALYDLQAAKAAFSTKREPKRAAAKPQPAGPRNVFELLEDGASDVEEPAAEEAGDAGESSGSEDSAEDVAVLRSGAASTAPTAAASDGVGSAAAAPPLPPDSNGGGGWEAGGRKQRAAPARPLAAVGGPAAAGKGGGPVAAGSREVGLVGGNVTPGGAVQCRICSWLGPPAAAVRHFWVGQCCTCLQTDNAHVISERTASQAQAQSSCRLHKQDRQLTADGPVVCRAPSTTSCARPWGSLRALCAE